jgi:histidyl-tRNA synthetase
MLPVEAAPLSVPRVYVAAFGEKAADLGFRILDGLREVGVQADTDFRCGTLKAHLRQADRLGALYTVLLGDDEVGKGSAIVRNMRTKAQDEVALADLPEVLKTGLGAA